MKLPACVTFDVSRMTLTFDIMENADCCNDCCEQFSDHPCVDCACHAPLEVSAKYEVCDLCHGKGSHSLAVDGHGITSSEWEQEWDEESRESYMRGEYDQTCEECSGARVVPVVDEGTVTPAVMKRINDYYADIARWAAEEAAERRMGA